MQNNIDERLHEISARIRELRLIMNITPAEMAKKTGVSLDEYLACEDGRSDMSFAFIYRCATVFKVDVTDIIEGTSPNLMQYVVTRAGDGQRIEKAHGMIYYNLAPTFRNRIAEPLYVTIAYDKELENKPIEVTTHEGQECDIVIKGSLMVQVGEFKEVLRAGDSIYYNSSTPHGMIAVNGEDCEFYAIVLNPTGAPVPELTYTKEESKDKTKKDGGVSRIWQNFALPKEDENGKLLSIDFKDDDNFNFAFDVVDGIAKEQPSKLALLHISEDKTERRFTFSDVSRESSRVANYLRSLGIKKGDRVMLVLKRHYQFWFILNGLHKLGAIAIPATNMLQKHDFEYRFSSAGVSAIFCTTDGDTARQVELAEDKDLPLIKIATGGEREGWHSFDKEYKEFSDYFPRTEDSAKGDDLMLMFFTSGTTGYPKIAAHNFKYPLGHFVTAKYWHGVNPDGLHLTIADTGWAKALWGKLYGQWLCEAAVFVYDFDRFDAQDILSMFAKYHITTFCAPPTMYRMMYKQDLSKFDLSSIEHATIAGEALNPEVFRLIEKQTGLQIHEGFGQSESTVVIANLVGSQHKLGSMGKVVPLYEVALLDPDGNKVPTGETGEICIKVDPKKPNGLFVGYYKDEVKTQEVWHDGYYHTGDIAWQDEEGYFYYVGRADDVIKSSGYRIGPFEIESVIMELPYVVECGVSASPDEVRGQVVKASIVLTKGTVGTDELKKEIQTYVKEHTAPYKYPRIVVFRDELPKTTSGKIIRSKL